MRFISCHNGKLQHLAEVGLKTCGERTFCTGIDLVDEMAPGGKLARGAVHEVLSEKKYGQARFFAAMLARVAVGAGLRPALSDVQDEGGSDTRPYSRPDSACMPIIWCDSKGDLYPPALVELGIDLANVYILRTNSVADENWAIAECLRCKGVGAVIAAPGKLSRIEARRFQLAAETGGSVGIFLRHTGRDSNIYAAATRWLVAPAPGERTVQRWKVQLVHGHGGRVNSSVFVEYCRENREIRAVRKIEELADRSAEAEVAARATA